MRAEQILKELTSGNSVVCKVHGNSMTPILHSGDSVIITPYKKFELAKKGDIVFCKVHGWYYEHLVQAVGVRGYLIANNHGHVNGWTKNVFGKVRKYVE